MKICNLSGIVRTALCLISVLSILILPRPIPAQQFPLRHYTSDDGLVHNNTSVVFQDNCYGYFWFGTNSGISRFDGKHFRNYTKKNSGLCGSVIRDITEDAHHNIWAGYTGGIARLERGSAGDRFVCYTDKDGLLGTDVLNLWADPQSGIWILTNIGVSYLNNDQFTSYPLDKVDAGLFSSNLEGSPQEDIFVFTRDGLFQKKPNYPGFKRCNGISFSIRAIRWSFEDESLYLVSNSELYNYKKGQLTRVAKSPFKSDLTNFSLGNNNTIWLFSKTGLWQRTPHKDKLYPNEMLRDISSPADALEDREGNLWMASSAGIFRLVNSQILNYTQLPVKIVTQVIKDPYDNLWVSGDRGIVKIRPDDKIIHVIKSSYVESILTHGNMLFSCPAYEYLSIYDLQGNLLREFNKDYDYTCALKDRNGKYWVGTQNGLFSIDNFNQNARLRLEFDTTDGLGSNAVWNLMEDKEGRLWVGTDNGLSCLSDGLWQHFSTKDGLSHNSVWDLYEHEDWGFLTATSQGISKWKKDSFETLPVLSDKFISSIRADNYGKLWVGTGEGLFRLDSGYRIDLALNKAKGLPANSVYIKSILVDSPYLYIGSHKGLSKIELDMENDKNISPALDIWQVSVNQRPVDFAHLSHALKYSDNNIFFRFNAVYAHLPESISYGYYLHPVEKKWKTKTAFREAGYTDLAPGSYTFYVQAFADEGKKSDIQTVHFKIAHAYWQTWWFISLGVLMGLFSVGLTTHYIVRIKLRKNEAERIRLKALYEKQIELDRLKDDFLANTSHELRTPLNGIIGIAESLADGAAGPVKDRMKDNLVMIVNIGKRLSHLVNDMLDFSRLKHKDIKLQIKPVGLRVITNVIISFSAPFVANKPVRLINNIDANLPAAAGDENRVMQIMSNLLGNAIKFTNEGTIEISATKTDNHILIKVSDTGIGIRKDKFDSIFESFEQGDTNISRDYGGTGIGLSITKQLVELHGGQIWLESEFGKGSTFFYTLPVFKESGIRYYEPGIKETATSDSDSTDSDSETVIHDSEFIRPDSPSILAVDDDPGNLLVLYNHLSLQNFSVMTASNGAEALGLIESGRKPDLVLMDIIMPRMTGIEVCQEIRRKYSQIELPVIMLTAKDQVADLVGSFESGANDYLVKPFSKEELIVRVKTHINLARMHNNLKELNEMLEEKVCERTSELSRSIAKLKNTEEALVAANEQFEDALKISDEMAQRAGAASNSKSEFLASMSHEIRTPLNGILGYTQILGRDTSLSEQQAEAVETIHRCGEHLLMVIEDILDISKIEAGKVELKPTHFHLAGFLKNTTEIAQIRAYEKGISFDYKVSADLPQVVYSDETRLRQILLNLLNNAIKFTDNGKIAFTVSRELPKETDNRQGNLRIRFMVKDTGIGIPVEKLKEIFLPFHQAHDREIQIEGSGLGLAISRRLVNLMGEELNVQSIAGQGSTFWFDLEFSEIECKADVVATEEKKTVIGFKGGKCCVLIADDAEANRTFLKEALLPLGFEVAEAFNGADAIEKAAEIQPDLILMDLIMPIMNGFEATRQVRKITSLTDIVIIGVSANVSDISKDEGLAAGCDDWITKPVYIDELLKRLQAHLKLEWIYEDKVEIRATAIQSVQSSVIPPPQELLAEFHKLLMEGDVCGIQELAENLSDSDSEYRLFLDRIHQMAKKFLMNELEKYITQYMD